MKKNKSIGIKTAVPEAECQDINCPYHGQISVKGRAFIGKIVSKDTHKTARVSWERQLYIPKYERYEKRLSKVAVHNPKCIDAQVGDEVKIIQTKPISKTKHFVIIEKIEK